MRIDNIRDEKFQHNIINRKAAKISALSCRKIDKHEYLTGEEILPPDQRAVIEQSKFAYSLLGKAFEKQIKALEEDGKQLVKSSSEKKSSTHLKQQKNFLKNLLIKEQTKYKIQVNKLILIL